MGLNRFSEVRQCCCGLHRGGVFNFNALATAGSLARNRWEKGDGRQTSSCEFDSQNPTPTPTPPPDPKLPVPTPTPTPTLGPGAGPYAESLYPYGGAATHPEKAAASVKMLRSLRMIVSRAGTVQQTLVPFPDGCSSEPWLRKVRLRLISSTFNSPSNLGQKDLSLLLPCRLSLYLVRLGSVEVERLLRYRRQLQLGRVGNRKSVDVRPASRLPPRTAGIGPNSLIALSSGTPHRLA
ncbi:protein of unknown function (plasmid) [Caballeronia sp. S22]